MATNNPSRPPAVWVLPLDSGCGICVQQVFALQSSRYASEMAARGIRFARSPRHADIVLLTGPLAEAAREPLRRVLATVPEPRALVAVGNCAIDGCVFRGGAHIIDEAAEELDVNVEIAGCPPAPEAILDAIAEAALLLTGESTTSEEATTDQEDTVAAEPGEDDGEREEQRAEEQGAESDEANAGQDAPADDTRGGAQ